MSKTTPGANDYVIVYRSQVNDEWRWIRKAGNHKTLSVSSEGYRDQSHTLAMASRCNPCTEVRLIADYYSKR